jgi:4-diphosphocytidyl-2C-methyl-D-erythritol kinase
VLVLTLVAPALDLLGFVQPGVIVPLLGQLAASAAAAALLLAWARYPRTSWLAAATLAGLASLALRFAGADVAAALSLLTVVAIGIGGAFASAVPEPEAWLA